MEDDDFEKYLERIEEIYEIECLADDGIPAHLYNPEYREEKLKQILEEIENNAYEKAIEDFNDLADGKICKRGNLMRRLIMFKAVDCPISKDAISIEVCVDCKYKGAIERTNWQMWCKYSEGED
jgi:tRNA(Ile)-lysidine synthase TilS/MesJ